jgi:hypothetical protein
MGRRLQDSEEVGTSSVEQTSKMGLEINGKNIYDSITESLTTKMSM